MKHHAFVLLLGACLQPGFVAQGATLTQTFEVGEDTTPAWGSNWVAPQGYNGLGTPFLHADLGGSHAGNGTTANGQEASRSFRDNTVGLDVILGNQPGATASTYTVSMYVQLAVPVSPPASGAFHIIDGNYGERAVDIKIAGYADGGPFFWQVKNGDSSYATLSTVPFAFNTPYFISFTVNPTTATSSVTVAKVDALGVIDKQESLHDISIGGSVLSNGNNGQLFFHIEGSAGVAGFGVDNIVITDAIPEPASASLLGALAAAGLAATRRRARAAA